MSKNNLFDRMPPPDPRLERVVSSEQKFTVLGSWTHDAEIEEAYLGIMPIKYRVLVDSEVNTHLCHY